MIAPEKESIVITQIIGGIVSTRRDLSVVGLVDWVVGREPPPANCTAASGV